MKPQPARALEPQEVSRIAQFSNSLRDEAKKMAALAIRLRKKIDDPSAISGLLSENASLFESIDVLRHSATRLAEDCDRNAELRFLQLEASIKEICAKRKWRLDGQWPDFVVEYGVPIHIDEIQKTIIVGTTTRVAVGQLEDKLAATTADLIPKKFSAQKFMEDLQTAYDIVTQGSSLQASIYDVYRALVIQQQSSRFWHDAERTLFNPMSIDQFRARFSRMLEAGIGTAKDRRELRLFPPINPRDAVFIFQPSERRFGFVGRIEYVKS